MKAPYALCILAFVPLLATAPARAEAYRVGIYGDGDREVSCVSGSVGDSFEQVVWAFVPDDAGLVYLTLRLDFPENISLARNAIFHDQVFDVIYTDFAGGTVEWNLFLRECPSGWIEVYRHEFTLLDEESSRIRILGAHSWIRDCGFMLNQVETTSALGVNEANCGTVPTVATDWGVLKTHFAN